MSININVRRVHPRTYLLSVRTGNLGIGILSLFTAMNAERCNLHHSVQVWGAWRITLRTLHQPRISFINFSTEDSTSCLELAKRQEPSEPLSKAKEPPFLEKAQVVQHHLG